MKRVLIVDRFEPSFTSIEYRNLDITLKFISNDPKSVKELPTKRYARTVEYLSDGDRSHLTDVPDRFALPTETQKEEVELPRDAIEYDIAARTIVSVEVWGTEIETKKQGEEENQENEANEEEKQSPRKESDEKKTPESGEKKKQKKKVNGTPHETRRERERSIVLSKDPILIGKGVIDMSLKALGTPIELTAARKIRQPERYQKPEKEYPEWKRPADYVPLKKKTAEKEESLEEKKKHVQEEKNKQLEEALDQRYGRFSGKLYIFIKTIKNGQTTRSKLERTQEVLFKKDENAEDTKNKLQEDAENEAAEIYDKLIKNEFKVFLENKKELQKIQEENERAANEEEEEEVVEEQAEEDYDEHSDN